MTYGEVSVANEYWDRHEYLLDQMAEYAITSNASADQSIYQALKAEDDYLVQQMVAKGYATIETKDGKQYVSFTGENGDKRLTVTVKDVTLSGGNIEITSSSVSGSGKIHANCAEGIRIKNTSNMALAVENLVILEDGGHLTFNGVEQSRLEGFTGEVRSQLAGERPYFEISSEFAGSVTIQVGNETKEMRPDVTVTLNGQIANHAGSLKVTSSSDIMSTANMAAAGTLNLSAAGAVTQSYASGITNVGGSVIDQWRTETDDLFSKNQSGQSLSSNEVKVGEGSIIAGGDVVIAGDMINVNGLIQSGYAEYGIELNTD